MREILFKIIVCVLLAGVLSVLIILSIEFIKYVKVYSENSQIGRFQYNERLIIDTKNGLLYEIYYYDEKTGKFDMKNKIDLRNANYIQKK